MLENLLEWFTSTPRGKTPQRGNTMDKFFIELLDLLVNDPSFSEETHAALLALREKAEAE